MQAVLIARSNVVSVVAVGVLIPLTTVEAILLTVVPMAGRALRFALSQ